MRLIDADELKKDCRSVPDPKGRYLELKIIEDYEIDDASTVFDIPNNPTNGDVIKAMFPKAYVDDYDYGKDPVIDVYGIDDTEYITLRKAWWNAPYQKGGKVE